MQARVGRIVALHSLKAPGAGVPLLNYLQRAAMTLVQALLEVLEVLHLLPEL